MQLKGKLQKDITEMAGFIWFVIVMYIVLRCVSASKKNAKQTKPNVPRQPAPTKQWNQPQQSRTQWNQPQQSRTQQSRTQQSRTQSNRTQQRPTNTAAAKENSILEKAKANASQQFDSDTLEARGSADLGRVPLGDEIMKDKAKANHIHSSHEAGHEAELKNQAGVDDFDTYHLIDEVNDLIVKGYSGNLEFERDFLSEATDMLNRMYG